MTRTVLLVALICTGFTSRSSADYQVLWSDWPELIGDGPRHSYIGDVDGDGALEMAGMYLSQGVRIVDALTGTEEFVTGIGFSPLGVSLMDLDGDTTPEVLVFGGGSTAVIDFVGATAAHTAKAFTIADDLGTPQPNPFNPTTTISFALDYTSEVRLDVLNITGQRVTTLANRQLEAGPHLFTWDGKDRNGRPVTSGIYFYRVQIDGFSQTKKMVLLK